MYRGRFAPSPTGPLHAGSLVAALASYLDAKTHNGQWLIRIEDTDTPRCIAGMDQVILQQLAALGLHSDEAPVYQSERSDLYQAALDCLIAEEKVFPCSCSRKDVAEAIAKANPSANPQNLRHGELVYPGTCRHGMTQPLEPGAQPSWRFVTEGDVKQQIGDFVLKRADGCFTYQMAVVVDDALQGITHVVRGADLLDNTPRQIALQQALGYATPQYLHTPLVKAPDGEKLSKQNGAQALDVSNPMRALNAAAHVLGLSQQTGHIQNALEAWTAEWAQHRGAAFCHGAALYNSPRE
ncbi:MAG TPA: tRNA glutamyl-Q(34) synthetase GluQRS [Burkholderiaceae bacterium]|nr:tRNA glutamyl-Q(34) synthetase GluQRS [Burkholderiaceae bacterium]